MSKIKINPKFAEYTVIFLDNGPRKNDLKQVKICDMDEEQLRTYIKGFLATPIVTGKLRIDFNF